MSDRDAFRAEQQERRQFGKAKQHEKRLERAVRKQVAEEIADRLDRIVVNVKHAAEAVKGGAGVADRAAASLRAYEHSAQIAREIGSRDPA